MKILCIAIIWLIFISQFDELGKYLLVNNNLMIYHMGKSVCKIIDKDIYCKYFQLCWILCYNDQSSLMIRYVIEDDFLLKCPLFHLNCTKDKFSEIVLNFLDLYDMT